MQKKYDILIKQYPEDKEKYPHKDFASKDRGAAKLKAIRIVFLKNPSFHTSHTVQCQHQENIVMKTYPIYGEKYSKMDQVKLEEDSL